MSAPTVRARGIFGARRRRQPHHEAPPPRAADRLVGEAEGERGFTIATLHSGERALPVDRGMAIISPARLCRHVLVCGATGSGKTETLLRLAWTVAKCSDAPVFYLDGKGDRRNAQRFCGLMADAGRGTRVFPNEPFDAWRGRANEIRGRLMEVIDYSSEGPAAWYRDVAKNVLMLACGHPDGPPRSSCELLDRLDLHALRGAHSQSSAVEVLTSEQVKQVRLRYEAFFGQAEGALDGDWAWEDASAAYLLLDSLALREETRCLSRLLFEDFAHFFTTRKPRDRFCLLIVDEFSALAEGAGTAARIEQARGFNTALLLAPQVVAGMGDEVESARIRGSVETVICHRVNTPEEIVLLAGTRLRPEYSRHFWPGDPTVREGSVRLQHQYKVDPNRVRALAPGEAFVISCGQAMRVQVARAPEVAIPLPEHCGVESERLSSTAVPLEDRPSEEGVGGLPY